MSVDWKPGDKAYVVPKFQKLPEETEIVSKPRKDDKIKISKWGGSLVYLRDVFPTYREALEGMLVRRKQEQQKALNDLAKIRQWIDFYENALSASEGKTEDEMMTMVEALEDQERALRRREWDEVMDRVGETGR